MTIAAIQRNRIAQAVAQAVGSLTFAGGASGANTPTVRILRTGAADVGGAGEEFTIEMWIRTNAANADNPFSSGPTYAGTATNANILWDGDSLGSRGYIAGLSNGRPYLGVNNAGGTYSLVAPTDITDDVQRHIAFQFRVSDGLMEIFVDGNEDASFDGPAGAVDYDGNAPATDQYNYICKEKLEDTDTWGVTAEISCIRVSNVRRYTGTTYTVPTAPFTDDANTVGLYFMDEGSGSVMNDSSSLANHGALLGSPLPTWGSGSPF